MFFSRLNLRLRLPTLIIILSFKIVLCTSRNHTTRFRFVELIASVSFLVYRILPDSVDLAKTKER